MTGDALSSVGNLFTQSQDYKSQASESRQQSSSSRLASDFVGIIGSMIDYNSLKRDLVNYKIQADQIELQAQQRANQLREQFNQSVGSYTYSASRRGISVNSGSVRSNIESSAIALGKDLQTQKENAYMKAKGLRTKASIMKHQGKAKMYSDIGASLMDMASIYQGSNVGE